MYTDKQIWRVVFACQSSRLQVLRELEVLARRPLPSQFHSSSSEEVSSAGCRWSTAAGLTDHSRARRHCVEFELQCHSSGRRPTDCECSSDYWITATAECLHNEWPQPSLTPACVQKYPHCNWRRGRVPLETITSFLKPVRYNTIQQFNVHKKAVVGQTSLLHVTRK